MAAETARLGFDLLLTDVRPAGAALARHLQGLAIPMRCNSRATWLLAKSAAGFWMISGAPHTGSGACVTWLAAIMKVPFSPACFCEFVLSYLQRMVDIVHEECARVVKHTDGNIWPIIGDIVNTGIDGLNPLEPVAGMDLAQVKTVYGERVCLIGNIDCGELLSHAPIEEATAAVRHALAVGMPGGRYVLCSSNSIHATVNPYNHRTMVTTGLSEGWCREPQLPLSSGL